MWHGVECVADLDQFLIAEEEGIYIPRKPFQARGAWGRIRPMPNRVNIPVFSPRVYKQRNTVERFFNKLKHFKAVSIRYDKRDDNFLASIQLASIRI